MKLMKLALPLLVIFSLIMITACDDRSMTLPNYEISIEATPNTIYADDGITYSEIRVIVKDSDDFAVTGETVRFSSSIGHMTNSVPTDSSGVATSLFWDTGLTGDALIIAYVGDVTAVDTVHVLDTPEVTDLQIITNSTELNVDDITELRAVALNVDGYVPNGTIVAFTCTQGYFSDLEGLDFGNTVQAETNNGTAKTYYNSGAQAGTSTIVAQIGDISDTKEMTIHPGNPHYLYMDPDTTEVEANSGQTVNIITQIEDKYHNPVEAGVSVEFTTSLGNITPIANTNEYGIAEAEFAPGIEAGVALIEAVADSASGSIVIDVISDDASSISFVNQSIVAIDVAGTGGNESAELRVALKDLSGNLVNEDYMVHFELVDYPTGVEINMEGAEDDSVMSVNGEAVVSIKSGSVSGNVKVRAYTYTEAGIVISAEKSNIIVQAGPPTSVEFTFGGIDEAENIGGGLWRLQIAALITDFWNNPVSDDTVVFLSLDGDPQYATIETDQATVGNFNADQDSIPGVAYSYLTFDGAHTNDEITVLAITGAIPHQETFVLPLQQGNISVQAVPFHYEFLDNNQEYEDIELRIMLKDGQANLINGQIISFETTAGTPLEPTPPDTGDPYSGLTGIGLLPPYVGDSGILYKYLRCFQIEFPEPIPSPVPIQVQVNIMVLGTDVETSVTVTITDMAPPE